MEIHQEIKGKYLNNITKIKEGDTIKNKAKKNGEIKNTRKDG